ncbi:MAG: hypothetical protein V1936_05090 [Patescibacteria group bacterium]
MTDSFDIEISGDILRAFYPLDRQKLATNLAEKLGSKNPQIRADSFVISGVNKPLEEIRNIVREHLQSFCCLDLNDHLKIEIIKNDTRQAVEAAVS